MSEKNKELPDWIYLPPDVKEASLWDSFHDGKVLSCCSSLAERSVQLEVSVRHLLNEVEKAKNVNFLLKVHEVNSVRVGIHTRPLEKFEEPANIFADERAKLLEEYYAKGRVESLSWRLFEEALSSDPLMVSDAGVAANDSALSLRIEGFLDGEKFDDIYCEVFIRGGLITTARTDGETLSFEDFIRVGQDYWEDFSNRRPISG